MMALAHVTANKIRKLGAISGRDQKILRLNRRLASRRAVPAQANFTAQAWRNSFEAG
jgi:hypothetical protein